MAVCPHGNRAETCHSCYPRLAEHGVVQVKAPIVPPAPYGGAASICPHGEVAEICLKCFPERA